ncbi:MAG: nucleoside triphosphate pyrophosphohydrolase family protein [Gemmatimonadaceae bacterium]
MSPNPVNAATLDGYQSAARRTINRALSDEQRLLDAAAGLAEEAGEVLSHVRKHVMRGRTLDRDAVILELGDALWCVAVVADTLGISLNDVALRNVEKLHLRYPD